MITLLTGKPGTGKSAYAVKMLLEDADLQDRPIFTNITDLKLPHHKIDADWLRTWHKNAPPQAFILFDECQDVFEPRHASKAPPEFVNELAKHRKDYSVDFFLITQKPSLIDYAVRAHVGRYLHIRETGLSRTIHEAAEIVDFEEKRIREENAHVPYRLPKQAFGLYKSAEVHNKKPRRKLPNAVYLFAGSIVGLIVMAGYVYLSISDKTSPYISLDNGHMGGLPPMSMSSGMRSAVVTAVPDRIIEAMTPKDDHNPLSAPLYAAVVPPVVAPEIVGCIASKSRCACFSQQSTPVWLPEEQCRQRASGEYYDPYKQVMQRDGGEWTSIQHKTPAGTDMPSQHAPVLSSENPLPIS